MAFCLILMCDGRAQAHSCLRVPGAWKEAHSRTDTGQLLVSSVVSVFRADSLSCGGISKEAIRTKPKGVFCDS